MSISKIISIIISFILLIPSYIFSFTDKNTDECFEVTGSGYSNGSIAVNGEAYAAKMAADSGETVFTFEDGACDWFNYFALKYSSDAYIKGEIVYHILGENHSEEFFLEPGENELFYSFIDGVFDKVKANKILEISFEPLDKEAMDFTLLGIGLFNRAIPDDYVYIENSGYKIGVNLVWGGALSYLEDTDSNVQAIKKDGRIFVDSNAAERYASRSVNDHVNLINRFDAGRLIQQSYYGTFDYENGEFMGQKWNYNPVQGGNMYGDCSKIVDVVCTESSIYIKCRPLDWAKPAEDITPSYMQATYSIGSGVVNVSCRFVDFSGYKSNVTTQEMPAFYCIEPFNRFVYYSGDKPWTNDENLSYENKLIFWPDAGYPNFCSSENWAAFIGEFDDSFGIGIYVPNAASFLAGVCDRENTTQTDPSVDGSTSYIAAIETLNFRSFSPIEYSYAISTGTTAEIRENFSKIQK